MSDVQTCSVSRLSSSFPAAECPHVAHRCQILPKCECNLPSPSTRPRCARCGGPQSYWPAAPSSTNRAATGLPGDHHHRRLTHRADLALEQVPASAYWPRWPPEKRPSMDALAVSYAAELIRFGIETTLSCRGRSPAALGISRTPAVGRHCRIAAYDEHYGALEAGIPSRRATLEPADDLPVPVEALPLRVHVDPTMRGPKWSLQWPTGCGWSSSAEPSLPTCWAPRSPASQRYSASNRRPPRRHS